MKQKKKWKVEKTTLKGLTCSYTIKCTDNMADHDKADHDKADHDKAEKSWARKVELLTG